MEIDITKTKHIPSAAKVINVSSANNDTSDIIVTNFIDIWQAGINLQKIKHSCVFIDISDLSLQFREGFLNRAIQGLYKFSKHKTSSQSVRKVIIYDPRISTSLSKRLHHQLTHANEVRDIANEPANHSTPHLFCTQALTYFQGTPHISISTYDENEIASLGLGLITAVGKGSSNPPRFLIVDYNPPVTTSAHKKCICLIGKGVTMDTGGYSIKLKDAIYGMHLDDTGAAMVLGIIKDVATAPQPIHHRIMGICPLVENMVSDNAVKPGDVVTAYNKKTVEITNTDAEGRLILADALSFACAKFKPDFIIDFATLTNWSSNIHCHTSYTYFTLSEEISKKITEIGEKHAERSMRIPPWTEYMQYVKSDVADLKNYQFANCQNSDGFMATMFMLHFIPKQYRERWIHFDVKHLSLQDTLGMAEGFMSGLELVTWLFDDKKLMLKLSTKRAMTSSKSP